MQALTSVLTIILVISGQASIAPVSAADSLTAAQNSFAERSVAASSLSRASQTASILGIAEEVERLAALRNAGAAAHVQSRAEMLRLRGKVLRRIMQAVFQVQEAEDKLECEMAYAYNVQARQQRKVDRVNQAFNAANFTQLGVLYGTVEPYSRIHNQFIQSAVGTCVGAGLSIGLPLLNIMYNRFWGGVGDFSPPKFLYYMLDGKPVDGENLPPLVAKYLDSIPVGAISTRRQSLKKLWKERYHADLDKPETLAGIAGGKAQKMDVLNSRILLLWSLFTVVQGFDKDLFELLQQVSDFHPVAANVGCRIGEFKASSASKMAGLTKGAQEAADLLELDSILSELTSGRESLDDLGRNELRTKVLERILYGYLEMQIARDRCQEELNYQYDVVLAQMTTRRDRFLQKTYQTNFVQSGTLGACAGWCYLKEYGKAGSQLFIIQNSIGLLITTISLAATHGGWRKNEAEPNSLADFFNIKARGCYGFSPLVWNFINNPSTDEPGKSRREHLIAVWKKRALVSTDLDKPGSLEKLAAMPSCRFDTIKLVKERILLLTSLNEQFCRFDQQLLDLLNQVYPVERVSLASNSVNVARANLSAEAAGAANLLAIESKVQAAQSSEEQGAKLEVTRALLAGFLDTSATASLLTHEILLESQVLDHMNKLRRLSIQSTNIANFYQLGILGIVSDSMALSASSHQLLASNRINLVSGGLILGLAALTMVEGHGGYRLAPVAPSYLGAAFGRTSRTARLSPLMIKFLDAQSPRSASGLSRRAELIKYWSDSKLVNLDIKKEAVIDKLSAEGKKHNKLSETISLINSRIYMLYDLKALLRSSNIGFGELMGAVE